MLAVHSPDPLLSLLGSLGLGGSVGTALVLDFVVRRAEHRNLEEWLVDGPSLSEISPGRTGIAIVGSGGVQLDEASELIELMAVRWPAVVLRTAGPAAGWGTVPVMPLFSAKLSPLEIPVGAAVWQPVAGYETPPGPGPVMPRLSSRVARGLLAGHLPKRSRWISAWRSVWGLPWS